MILSELTWSSHMFSRELHERISLREVVVVGALVMLSNTILRMLASVLECALANKFKHTSGAYALSMHVAGVVRIKRS